MKIIRYIGFSILLSLLPFQTLEAQDRQDPDSKNLAREEQKALKKSKKDAEKRKRTEALAGYRLTAESRAWVIEAHLVYSKSGQSFPMNPTTNFVYVNGEKTTFQLAFNGISGWNGIGGITLDGTVNKYEVSENKSGITINMIAVGPGMGPVDLLITIGSDGNGRATISGNWGDRITFAGRFVPLKESSVYKGMPSY